MTVERHQVKVSTTGSAGSASGSSILALPLSELIAVYLDFNGSAPSTTDITITANAAAVGGPPSLALLTLTNVNSDGWYYPKVQDHNPTGSLVTGSYSDPPIHGSGLTVALAQADALTDALVATFYIRTD